MQRRHLSSVPKVDLKSELTAMIGRRILIVARSLGNREKRHSGKVTQVNECRCILKNDDSQTSIGLSTIVAWHELGE